MGRSSAEQALRNRARIVEGASRLFRERGVEAVSVADIMAAVEMTVGGFYKHFASKEALVEEATGQAFDEASALWAGILDRPDRPDHEARAVRARLVAQYLRPNPQRHCPIIAFAPHAASPESSAPSRSAYDRGTGALLEKFFAGTAADGADPDPAQADPEALLLFAAMVGARVLGEAAGEVDWVQALRKAVIDAAERGAGA